MPLSNAQKGKRGGPPVVLYSRRQGGEVIGDFSPGRVSPAQQKKGPLPSEGKAGDKIWRGFYEWKRFIT